MATRTHAIVKGRHNQKTLSFVKACVAYAHITIPTLESTDKQCRYFYQTAQVALQNGLIGETDSLLKGVLSTMDENFDQKKLPFMTDMFLNMLGFLIIVPSNPETTFFQLTEGILNMLKDHEWGN